MDDRKSVFEVEVKETLSRTVKVEANNIMEAISMVMDMYGSEEIVLDSNDFVAVEYLTDDVQVNSQELDLRTVSR